MSVAISEILVVTDMDGTLLAPDHTIPPSTLETIRLFKALGGRFTVATGRPHASVGIYPQLAEIIDPAITSNGCIIYDFKDDKPLRSVLVPRLSARKAVRDIAKTFPSLGVMIYGEDCRFYMQRPSDHLQGLIADEKMFYFHRPISEIPEDWNKVLFSGPASLLQRVDEFVNDRTYPGVYFVNTNEYYYEMMPKGVSKGSAIHDLCDLLGVSVRNTYAIGDYYNDVQMLKQAGHAIVMGNAPSDIKLLADEVIPTNEEAGVGQFLYKIIQKYA